MIEALVASAQIVVNEALSRATLPALLFSGGKESSVMHYLVQQYTEQSRRPITHIVFCDEVQEERLAFIEQEFKREQFPVLRFRPRGRKLVPVYGYADPVSIYDLRGQGDFEAAVHAIPGDMCLQEWLHGPIRLCPDFCFDLLLLGGRATDYNDYYGYPFEWRRMMGDIEILNPLYHWTVDQVWEAIHTYKISYDIDRYDYQGNNHIDVLKTCTGCVQPGLKLVCKKNNGESVSDDSPLYRQ